MFGLTLQTCFFFFLFFFKNIHFLPKSSWFNMVHYFSSFPLLVLSPPHSLTLHTGWQTWTSFMLAERVRENIESSEEYQQEREKEEKRRTLVRVMKRMIHSSLSTALLTWHQQAVHLKRVETLSRNISRRWRNVELHRSLNGWRASVVERVQRRHGVARVRARWMLSSQSRSFTRWSQMVSERTAARSLLSRMATISKHSSRETRSTTMRQSWRLWWQLVDRHRLSVMDVQEREREMERRRSVILRFVKRMRRRKIAIGWTCWWCHVQSERERERKTKRALARWL